MAKKLRQYGFTLLAGLTYLLIHEVTHLVQALLHGIFRGIKLHPLGVEILIVEPLTIMGLKLALFSGLSSLVTISIGYIIFALSDKIITFKNQFIRNFLYYVCVVFLLLDPFYISIISLKVGGDINGIALGLNIPYMPIRFVYLVVFILNLYLVIKKVYPKWTQIYKENSKS